MLKIEGIEKYKNLYNMTNEEYEYFLDRIGVLLDTHPHITKNQAVLAVLDEVKQEQAWIEMQNITYH